MAIDSTVVPLRRRLGSPRKANLREVMNAILYMASTGCQWRMLPKEFPPFTTAQNYFHDWRDNGILRLISNTPVAQAREKDGREAIPSTGVIDIQRAAVERAGCIFKLRHRLIPP
ncbi:transposase [Oricola thermophila]|uniref:Transposase n=1 Tax=Oricola thermophila TaxID=2742145 RepID=A0A6N1VJE3_9HYPH|nr:transposase [Oricola thermophila]